MFTAFVIALAAAVGVIAMIVVASNRGVEDDDDMDGKKNLVRPDYN